MNEMVERMARAMEPGEFDTLPDHGPRQCQDCDYNRSEAVRKARDAIAAMGDPTQEMKRAFWDTMAAWINLNRGDDARGSEIVTVIWRAMIEEAGK